MGPDRRSLRFRLSLYFVLFAAGLLAVLWASQVFFLGTFYERMKTAEDAAALHKLIAGWAPLKSVA